MIKKLSSKYLDDVINLMLKLWPDNSFEELKEEVKDYINNKKQSLFIKVIDNLVVGFAEVSIRSDYVEGTNSSPVGYLEGIYVLDEYRKMKIAKDLLASCEEWAKKRGCTEFASDCELTNTLSQDVHKKLGFTKTNIIVCYKKDLK